jgi:peptidyl-prolyl cis-trans isomerase B (cyclophilin B)
VRRALAISVILLAMIALAACGKDPVSKAGGSSTTGAGAATATVPTATTDAASAIVPRSARDGCKAVPAPLPSEDPTVARPTKRLSRKRRYVATLRTNCGTIRIALDVRHAPKTTSSFAGLAGEHYYDGLTFHRIAKPLGRDFVVQGGDPLLTGNGGPGYSVVEPPPTGTQYRRGAVAMAKTESEPPGTSGSQFFIVTAKDSKLPPEYAIVGRVVGSTKAVRRIARLTTDPVSEMPLDPVVIKSIRVRRE